MDKGLGVGIDCAGRLIENKNAGVCGERTCEGEELAFARAKVAAALAHLGLVTILQM